MHPEKPLILHFTAALGGGLEAVIHDYVRSAPGYDHELLYSRRGDFAIGRASASSVAARSVGAGPAAQLRALRATVAELSPAVLHLHSVTAGVIGRLGVLPEVAVVYTPHSYFHERRSLPAAMRIAARSMETALRRRTDLVIAVSPAEAATAVSMGIPAMFVPNVGHVPVEIDALTRPDAARWDVVGSGRLSAQKDPLFFAQVKTVVDRIAPGLRWAWVGGGDDRTREELEHRGVHVSGWVSRESVLTELSASRIYLHTAAWEGNPVSLLEVERLGVPAVARSIPSLVSLGHRADLVTPEQVAVGVLDQLSDEGSEAAPSRLDVAGRSQEAQRVALEAAYARAGQLRDLRLSGDALPMTSAVRSAVATKWQA